MYNAVTGTRRSGTSLMMFAIRTSGIPIIGFKYIIHTLVKENGIEFVCGPSEKIKQSNPNGYWEMGSITTLTGLTKDFTELGIKGDVIKIVAETFFRSDPEMIDKTIIMMRNPRVILNSQIISGICREEADIEETIKKNVYNLLRTFNFLVVNKKDFVVVDYDGFIKEPKYTMKQVCKFLGRGNWRDGAKAVDPNLSRSKELQGNYKGLDTFENIYRWSINNQIDKILKLNPI